MYKSFPRNIQVVLDAYVSTKQFYLNVSFLFSHLSVLLDAWNHHRRLFTDKTLNKWNMVAIKMCLAFKAGFH